jgi:hypothetical protein
MPTFFSKRDELVHCFRTGMGMTYDALGADCACGTHRELVSSSGSLPPDSCCPTCQCSDLLGLERTARR